MKVRRSAELHSGSGMVMNMLPSQKRRPRIEDIWQTAFRHRSWDVEIVYMLGLGTNLEYVSLFALFTGTGEKF